jgi:hypothetical protein
VDQMILPHEVGILLRDERSQEKEDLISSEVGTNYHHNLIIHNSFHEVLIEKRITVIKEKMEKWKITKLKLITAPAKKS